MVRLFCIWVGAGGFSVIKLGSKPFCCSNLGRRMDSTFTTRLLSTTIGVRNYLFNYCMIPQTSERTAWLT